MSEQSTGESGENEVSQEFVQMERMIFMEDKKPLSPHIQIYRGHSSSLVSI